MEQENIKVPREALRLRRILKKLELSELEARTKMNVCSNDAGMLMKMPTKKDHSKAMNSQKELKIYQIYLDNIKTVKEEFNKELEHVLRGYSPLEKQVWVMAFIDGFTVEEIANKTNYSNRQIQKLIKDFKEDLRNDD